MLYDPEDKYQPYFNDCEHIFSDPQLYTNTIQYMKPLTDNFNYSSQFIEFYTLAQKIMTLFNQMTEIKEDTKQILSTLPNNDVTLTVQTKDYKVSQILKFVKFAIYKLSQQYKPEELQNLTFIDMGTGKGYILTHLAYSYCLKSIGVDASIQHVISCCRRLQSLKKNNERKLKQYVENMYQNDNYYQQRMQNFKLTSDSLYPLITLSANYIDEFTSLTQLEAQSQNIQEITSKFQNQFNQIEKMSLVSHKKGNHIYGDVAEKVMEKQSIQDLGKERKFIILSLHACGDFSVNSMQMIQNPEVEAVFNVPCCYQRLTEQKFCLNSQFLEIYERFLNSKNIFEPKIHQQIPKHILVNAAASYRQTLENEIQTVDSNLKRAILEKFRYQLMDQQTYKERYPYSAVNIKNELIEMCKENLKRELNYDMTENDIIEAQKLYSEENIKLMKTYTVFRKISGQIVESMIIVDRMLKYNFQCEQILSDTTDRKYCLYKIKQQKL